ncbi:hypothetical protein Sjap_011442 [Stephania japonica]|uniref:Uncharacterized protein n=1 Tax=Stephania japonica TaxID=461633 RepID=A0AAP0JCE8_9MAGN
MENIDWDNFQVTGGAVMGNNSTTVINPQAQNCSTNLGCRGRYWFVRRKGRGWWRFVLWRGKGVVAVRVLEEPDQLQGLELFHESWLSWSLLVRTSEGKGVVAICALKGKGGGGGMAPSKKPMTREETGNTVGLRGGHRGRRPQTASYRKSKDAELARATNASDVAEVHNETSAVNASATATVGREIELHKSQVTIDETSSSDSIEEEQDESQEQEADGEDKSENEDQEEADEEGEEEGEEDGEDQDEEGEQEDSDEVEVRSHGKVREKSKRSSRKMVQEEKYDLSRPCPGRPSDQTILSSFNNHVADAIWNNERLRRTVDIVLKWRSLPPGEADMASAFKMADDVLMHLTGKGVASSATATSGGNEPTRKSEHDSHATQSQSHTNANESDPSKRREHGKLQHKKKRSKTNE